MIKDLGAPDLSVSDSAPSHTPGPWHVDPKRSLRVAGPNDETICSTGAGDSTRDQWEANARLIARVPDILETLKKAERGLSFAIARMEPSDLFYRKMEATRRTVQAAIARANGASPPQERSGT